MADTSPQQPDDPRTPAIPGSGTLAADAASPPLRLLHTPPAPHGPATNASVPDLVGRFHIGEELARGGMGVVYRAHQPSVGRDVAVKVIKDEFRGDERMAARFLSEARVTGQLQHPGIPPVFEVGALPDGSPFLAMKLIKGQTLADLLRARPDPSADRGRFVAVFEQVAQAVGSAHAHGVIHRDLKPANVMVGAHGEVQVMDWGLAKVLTEGGPPVALGPAESTLGTEIRSDRGAADRTRAGAVLGTPAYMPREQAIGAVDQIDQRSDVFGLGAILCVILTGRPPYAAPDGEAARQVAAVANLADAFARLDASGAEPGLVELCRRCLSAEKADRPADGGAVARAVADLRAAAEERARRAEVERAQAELRLVEGRRRRRVQWVLAAAVGLLALGGVALVKERQFKERQARDGIEAALKLSIDLRKQYRFREAADALEQASQLTAGAPELAPSVERARADLAFVRDLDDVRMKRSTWIAEPGGKGRFDTAGVMKEYPEAFKSRGLDVLGADPGEVAAAVAGSPVRAELVAALDDWAALRLDQPDEDRLLGVLRQADPGPWLDAFRNPSVRRNRMALGLLARSADPAALHPATLTALAEVMKDRGLDPSRLLLRAQFARPGDFLIPFQLGLWYLSVKKEPDAAIAHYLAARVTRPVHRSVLNNLGIALKARGELDEAIKCYREAVRLDPTYAPVHYNLGNALNAKGEWAGAVASFREVTRLDPTDVQAHSNLGNALRANGDLAGAIASYREAIRLDPKLAPPHNNLGNALRARGKLDEAIGCYREATRLDPGYASPHNGLGNALKDKGNLDGAIGCYREATRIDPGYAVAHHNLALALSDKGEWDEAIGCYREAVRLDPTYVSAHYNLGNALSAKRDWAGAIASYREAVRLDPTDALAYYGLAFALNARGELDEAIGCYREATRLDPKLASAHYNLGLALKDKGDLDGAIGCYREAIRLDPKLATTVASGYHNLGIALTDKKNLDGAIAAYREAIRLDPKHAKAHTNLAGVYAQQRNYPEAIACARTAIRADPKYSNAHAILGRLLQLTDDLPGARAAFTEATRLDPRWKPMLANLPLDVAPPPRPVAR
jgi:tetratricopeptide (TPR) repeat protein